MPVDRWFVSANSQINLICLLAIYHKTRNNFFAVTLLWEDYHFTKENLQNYGWCTAQNLLQKTTETTGDSTSSRSLHTCVNELHYQQSEIFQTNSSIHNINTRNKHHLHRANNNPPCIQKRTFYAGIKIFNSLPLSLTILKNDKVKFRAALRKYLNIPRCTLWLIYFV